uniref:Cnidarian restricted protein n=1 Tax=Clytia hemisphaerica TaxID=252671 RepID=A0A7M5V4K2_9CNID
MIFWINLMVYYVLICQSDLVKSNQSQQNSTRNRLFQENEDKNIPKLSNETFTNKTITNEEPSIEDVDVDDGREIDGDDDDDKEITYFDKLSPLHRKKIVISGYIFVIGSSLGIIWMVVSHIRTKHILKKHNEELVRSVRYNYLMFSATINENQNIFSVKKNRRTQKYENNVSLPGKVQKASRI